MHINGVVIQHVVPVKYRLCFISGHKAKFLQNRFRNQTKFPPKKEENKKDRNQKKEKKLGSMTGPHTKEVWTSKLLGCATRL
jgi:hypothetical protein